MEYKIYYEGFRYGVETIDRKRPSKFEAVISTDPVSTTKRTGGPFPIALKPADSGTSDFLPHNTVGGHVLGLLFGGPHIDGNLVPMYGHFNNGGVWSKLEATLSDQIYAMGNKGDAKLLILINYDQSKDPRIPSSFNVTLTVTKNDGKEYIWRPDVNPIIHTIPEVICYDYNSEYLYLLFRLQMAMENENWFVEDHVGTTWGPKHIRYGEKLVVPSKNFKSRPYAVLDYMIYKQNLYSDYKETLNNEAEFSDKQKNLIYQTNIALNLGYITSNASDDYVHEQGKTRPQADYFTDAFSLTQKRGLLIWNGGHQKPEVDHIVPKDANKNRGSNAYSNAQVTSSFYNNQKRTGASTTAMDIWD